MNPPGWFLKMCIQRFGLSGGLHVYQQLKFSGAASFKLPGYTGKLHYRPHTADLVTFREIFLREAYRIPFPTTFNPRFIVDAGANIGFTSVFWANLYPQAQILALEPEPDNFSLLSKNATVPTLLSHRCMPQYGRTKTPYRYTTQVMGCAATALNKPTQMRPVQYLPLAYQHL